ncbi:hypothetical protein [Nocardiopsis halophila]|uniref:hypothetical protein n=1 Tax=Nocardiopsis halophila TaxID=141692 RepID=UPI000477F3AB|nr:hypothetical protein [Nocardiopsis halophila]
MRVAVRAGAAVCLAAVAVPVVGAPPAQAAPGGVDAAVEAFASGALVHTGEGAADDGGGAGASPGPAEARRAEQAGEFVRARLGSAEVPVRAEILAEGDPDSAAQEIADRVGMRGLYVAAVERGGGEEAEFGWSWVGPAPVGDEEIDAHLATYPGGPLQRIAGIVDLIDGDLRPAVEAAARSGDRVYVDPSIAEGFPQADAEALAERLGGVQDVRVAVVPALAAGAAGGREEVAEAMLAPVGDAGSALLAEWEGGAFRLTPASGEGGPAPKEITSLLPEALPGELGAAVGTFAGAVHGGVVRAAREALADRYLYVDPLAATDLEEGDAGKVEEALAEREEPVRVAVLPQGAFLETGATGPGEDALAASVAQGVEGPVAVYTVDGSGAVTGYPVRGGDGVGGNWESLDSAVFFGKADDSVRESLDGLLEELGERRVLADGGGAAGAGASGVLPDLSRTGWSLIGGAVGLVLLVLLLRGAIVWRRARR